MPVREARDAALERPVAAVHVDVQFGRLADPQLASCVSLKLASTQISVSERISHQRFAGLHVVARVDVSPRDHAIDLGNDVAVAKIEFGLIEVGLGFVAFCLGELDRRRPLDELGENAVEVFLRIWR